MFKRILFLAAALAAAPSAFAQQAEPEALTPSPLPLFYSSAGIACSREVGLELEAGLQIEIAPKLFLSFSPVNIALIDGDTPAGYIRDNEGFQHDCRIIETNVVTLDEYCTPELDTEWRSVAQAQFQFGPDLRIGGGVSYLLQGSFRPEDGRVAPFASLSWGEADGIGFELRGGPQYVALQLRGLW